MVVSEQFADLAVFQQLGYSPFGKHRRFRRLVQRHCRLPLYFSDINGQPWQFSDMKALHINYRHPRSSNPSENCRRRLYQLASVHHGLVLYFVDGYGRAAILLQKSDSDSHILEKDSGSQKNTHILTSSWTCASSNCCSIFTDQLGALVTVLLMSLEQWFIILYLARTANGRAKHYLQWPQMFFSILSSKNSFRSCSSARREV